MWKGQGPAFENMGREKKEILRCWGPDGSWNDSRGEKVNNSRGGPVQFAVGLVLDFRELARTKFN